MSAREEGFCATMASYTAIALGGGSSKARNATPGSINWAMYSNETRSWGDLMTGMRPATKAVRVEAPITGLELTFRVWKDMMENPAQYGDDIEEWLALDEELRLSRKCWKRERYLRQRDAEEETKLAAEQAKWRKVFTPIATQAAVAGARRWVERDIKRCIAKFRGSAVKIQSAVRGHQARQRMPFRDCCMCLSHRICPFNSDVGHICPECVEQGPYAEETGPLSDPWSEFRADVWRA